MPEQKNLILAIVLSLAIIIGFEFLLPSPAPRPGTAPSASERNDAPRAGARNDDEARTIAPGPSLALPPASASGPRALAPRAAAARPPRAPRVTIDTPELTGSLSLTGARFDDLTLREYRERTDAASANITLLAPRGSPNSYYAAFGWTPSSPDVAVPNAETVWSADRDALTPTHPVTLRWNNGHGLTFIREISVDDHYLFTIKDTVRNATQSAVTLSPYGLITRGYTPKTRNFYILHEGPLGVFNGTLKEMSYADLREEPRQEETSTGGWIGVTDKYWLTAITLNAKTQNTARFLFTGAGAHGGHDRYQVDFLGAARAVPPGGAASATTDFFAGAKKVDLLDEYAETHAIDRFDLAIDFGWFYFLTKPFFLSLQWLHGRLGNFGLAIIAFTATLRVLLYPLANKSYKSMRKMKTLQPKIKDLQDRFKDDRQRMQQEMMALYKREGANPVSGCLPMLIQIPIFFALYKVLFVSLEMRHAPFYLWIKDLSAPDPTNLFTLFGLIPWAAPSFLTIGVLPLIMGVTMWAQQRMNPTPPDPIQAKIMAFLPVIFTLMLARFPAGLVLYWTCNNTLSATQQWIITRRLDAAEARAGAKANA